MKYVSLFISLAISFPFCIQAEEISSPTLYQKIQYEASLAYTQLSSNAWWTKIEPFNLYLGALPLKNKGHLEDITALGITRVLSLVEDFELKDGYFNTPVKSTDWKKNGIAHKQIQAIDFLPLTPEAIKEGIEYLAESLESGHTVYVHCKAGRGRSAAIVIAYLMQYHELSFDEAFALVQTARPQINLNNDQRQAISSYFSADQKEISSNSYLSEENLAYLLDNTLYYVIEGMSYSPDQHAPQALAAWLPSLEVESTLSRRNRYLREYQGDQDAAVKGAIKRNHNYIRQLKIAASSAVPVLGMPTSYSISLWYQLREIALIAAIYGHDIHDPEVRTKMVGALVTGDLMKLPSASVDMIARHLFKKILLKTGVTSVTSSVLPVHVIFNYFSDNAAKVSTHAISLFGGENRKEIPIEEYQS